MAHPSQVLIVDDHEFIRRGVRALLSGNNHLKVCGEATNGREAVEKVRNLHPDIVILDISMPVMNGVEAASQIRRVAPETKIVMLTMHDAVQMRRQALSAGADAYLVKSDVASGLTQVLDSVLAKGETTA